VKTADIPGIKRENTRDLYRGINGFKRVYQPRIRLVKDDNGDLLADSDSILNGRNNYLFIQLNQLP
jgi:hypothetical protein